MVMNGPLAGSSEPAGGWGSCVVPRLPSRTSRRWFYGDFVSVWVWFSFSFHEEIVAFLLFRVVIFPQHIMDHYEGCVV